MEEIEWELNRLDNEQGQECISEKIGEELVEKGFVKTHGFDGMITFIMSLTQQIWRVAQKYKGFRMELHYDAETLNTEYYFFVPTDKCAATCMNQEGSAE